MTRPKVIYTVTCVMLTPNEHNERSIEYHSLRCWFPTLKDAKRCVKENWNDIFEAGHYSHAVIERVGAGVMVHANREWWYQAVYKETSHRTASDHNPAVRRIKKPLCLAQLCAFGMG